ncbi:hypothetical protein Rs2_38537 [Raphanus sativus]|nr:hypothetical protein Rs2_38537 [Raphanus sativus]
MGEEEHDTNDENRDKAPKKKGGRPGPLAIGGSTKMRLVQSLVSPRKKNAVKTGGKIGDKGAEASKKATMKPKTSEKYHGRTEKNWTRDAVLVVAIVREEEEGKTGACVFPEE